MGSHIYALNKDGRKHSSFSGLVDRTHFKIELTNTLSIAPLLCVVRTQVYISLIIVRKFTILLPGGEGGGGGGGGGEIRKERV